MRAITLGTTDLTVSRLCLGGNVFGWSADRDESFAVLDAYAAAGGNFIDTADAYSWWIPGNSGGESEAIIGEWMTSRGNRDSMVIATKVAKLPEAAGLAPENIRTALAASLERLQTDYLDLYYAHEDDDKVELSEVLGTFDSLIKEGKVRHIACSNFTPERVRESVEFSRANGLAQYVAVQDLYNLMDRNPYESTLRPVAEEFGLASLPYYSLARGFLTGKYAGGAKVESVRASGVSQYENERGERVIEALGIVAAETGAPMGAVALAWLAQKPTIATPIASARTLEQLDGLLAFTELDLSDGQMAQLDTASVE